MESLFCYSLWGDNHGDRGRIRDDMLWIEGGRWLVKVEILFVKGM